MSRNTNTVFYNPLAQYGYGIYKEFHEYMKENGLKYSYHYMYVILNGPKRSKGLVIEKAAAKFAHIKRAEYEEAQAILAQAL